MIRGKIYGSSEADFELDLLAGHRTIASGGLVGGWVNTAGLDCIVHCETAVDDRCREAQGAGNAVARGKRDIRRGIDPGRNQRRIK